MQIVVSFRVRFPFSQLATLTLAAAWINRHRLASLSRRQRTFRTASEAMNIKQVSTQAASTKMPTGGLSKSRMLRPKIFAFSFGPPGGEKPQHAHDQDPWNQHLAKCELSAI